MPNHLYLNWSAPGLHNVRDPEGLLSDLPACGTALLGLLAALWLRGQQTGPCQNPRPRRRQSQPASPLGYLWSIEFPLNKNLWTSSFVLVAAGYSLLGFTLAYWAIEQHGWGRGKSKGLAYPWLVFGSNAIVAYMFSELVPSLLNIIPFTTDGHRNDALSWFFTSVCSQIPDPGWAAFSYAVAFLALCFVPVWLLYRKKIFVKV